MLERLQRYLNDNNCEILDYYSKNGTIIFIRTININTGIISMIEINDFNISDNIYLNGISLVKKMSLVKNDEEDYPENIIIYYDKIRNLFPEYNNFLIIQIDNYIIKDRTNIYKILDTNSIKVQNFYWKFNLEWFYENINSVEYEIHQYDNNLKVKIISMLRTIENNKFIDNKTIHNLEEYYNECFKKVEKYRELYISMNKTEKKYKLELFDLDKLNIISNFNDSLRNQHQKSILKRKIQELFKLKEKTIKEYNLWNSNLNKIILEVIHFVTEITIIMSKLNSLIVGVDEKIPKKHFFK